MNNKLTDERLAKILSETQATINEHNRRQVRGSVEVDARLFESMLAEIQLRRHLMEKAALAGMEVEPVAWLRESAVNDIHEGAWTPIIQMESQRMGANLTEAWGVSYIPLYTAPQPLTTAERAELENYRNAEFMPKNLDRALTIMGVSLPESKEEFNLQAERWMQRLIDRVIRCESELAMQSGADMTAELESARQHIAELEAAPPAPVGDGETPVPLMPDFPGRTLTQRECYRAGFEAASVQHGWVACSEQMPNIGVPVITCCGDVVQYAVYAWDGKEWQDWYEEYDKLPANTFTHWHSRPAAPLQEVKS